MTPPRTHPAGVVIPPDPGDHNHDADSLGGWMGQPGAERDLVGEVYDLLLGVASDLEPALWTGDNAEACRIVQSARHRLRREAGRIHLAHGGQNAPQKPQAPSSGPDGGSRGSLEEGSETADDPWEDSGGSSADDVPCAKGTCSCPRDAVSDRDAAAQRVKALRDALSALDGHDFHDTAHNRVRQLLRCDECGHLPEQHENDGRGACQARIGARTLRVCDCAEWEAP